MAAWPLRHEKITNLDHPILGNEDFMPTLQIISDVAEFMALEAEWNALAEPFRTPLLRHEWFAACLSAYGEGKELAIFAARQNGKLRAAAPFVIDRGTLLPRLCALGYETTEPGGFIYADDEALGVVAKGIVSHGLPMMLPRLGADSAELRSLRASTGLRGVWFVRRGNTATATVPLGCDFATIESRVSPADQRNIRRRIKLAERDGPVSFEMVVPTPDNVHLHLRELYRVEAASWKSRTGTAILSDAHTERFCTAISVKAAQMGTLRISILRIGSMTAAACMNLEYAGRLWGLKQGYDERWAACAPGILMAHESIRYACEKGLISYEFLGSAEKFQTRWPVALTAYSRLRFYPLLPRSAFALCEDALRLPLNWLQSRLRSKSGSLSGFIRPAP
jgi:CelD/BcsL family acetyltransferase involved in cellulose biosynthesis